MFPLAKFGWTRGSSGGGAIQSLLNTALQWLRDSTLTDKTTPAYDAEWVDSPCGTFDGAGDSVDTGFDPTVNAKVMLTARALDISVAGYFFGANRSADRFSFGWGAAGDFTADDTTVSRDSGVIADTEWHEFGLDASAGTFEIDGSIRLTGLDYSGVASIARTLYLGANNGFANNYGNCEILEFKLYESEELTQHLVFTEKSGSKVYDASGNGNDGTITTGAGGLDAFWAGTQDVSHYFAENGGSKVLSFDGSSTVFDYNSALIDATQPFTASTWFRCSVANETGYIAFQGINGTFPGKEFQVLFVSGILNTTVGTAGDQPIGSLNQFTDGEWYKCEVVSDGVNATATVYNMSGVSQATDTYAIGLALAGDKSTTLGGRLSGALGSYATHVDADIFCFEVDGIVKSESKYAYEYGSGNIIIPDSVGTNDASDNGTGVEELYIPAGSAEDTALGTTNPAGLANNNPPSKFKWKDANTQALDNEFWSADGSTYDKKDFGDLVAHAQFDHNVVTKCTADGFFSDVITWAQDYAWTPSAYQLVLSWIGTPCWADALTPLTDVDDEYLIDANGELIFPAGG